MYSALIILSHRAGETTERHKPQQQSQADKSGVQKDANAPQLRRPSHLTKNSQRDTSSLVNSTASRSPQAEQESAKKNPDRAHLEPSRVKSRREKTHLTLACHSHSTMRSTEMSTRREPKKHLGIEGVLLGSKSGA